MGMKVFASGMNFGARTPGSDTTQKFSALYIGTTGNVAIKSGATDVVFANVQSGSFLPIKGEVIDDGLTTATDVVWLDW